MKGVYICINCIDLFSTFIVLKDLLRLNMLRQCSIPKEGTKNSLLRFAFSKIRRTWSFHVDVLQRTHRNVPKFKRTCTTIFPLIKNNRESGGFIKIRSGRSRDFHDAIVSEKLRFQNVFLSHENEKPEAASILRRRNLRRQFYFSGLVHHPR